MEVHEVTECMVSSLGYMVYGFESMGYLVSRVWGTWFRECGVHSCGGTGYIVAEVQGT